jgi:hypothetical protein
MNTQVPSDFINDYYKSKHYQVGDEVVDIEAGYHYMGYTYINLVISRGDRFYILPFYYNQMPNERPYGEYSEDESNRTEAEEIEEDVDAWLESMAGATVWTEWYDNVELEEY